MAWALALSAGCGYTLQNSSSPLADKENIHRIYVTPVINNSYKAGAENLVYNALMRSLSIHRRVVLVTSPEEADAVLMGYVTLAQYGPSASSPAQSLNPANSIGVLDPFYNTLITSEYNATLECNFELRRRHFGPKQKEIVWQAKFSRGKPFPASNQLGAIGTTSALINESEFDRALSEIARSMMDDVHESMLAMF